MRVHQIHSFLMVNLLVSFGVASTFLWTAQAIGQEDPPATEPQQEEKKVEPKKQGEIDKAAENTQWATDTKSGELFDVSGKAEEAKKKAERKSATNVKLNKREVMQEVLGLNSMGKRVEALEKLEQLHEAYPRDMTIVQHLMKIYRLQTNRLSAANKRTEVNSNYLRMGELARIVMANETLAANEKVKEAMSIVFYNEACAHASLNNIDEAMKSFRLTIAAGFRNIDHVMNDPDLREIRETEEFKELMAEPIVEYNQRLAEVISGMIEKYPPKEIQLELKLTTGESVSLGDYSGKVVVLAIGGSWCKHCELAVPEYKKTIEHFKGQDVVVLGVAFENKKTDEERAESAREYVTKYNIDYPCLVGTVDLRTKIDDFPGFPCAVFIGREGKIRLAVGGVRDSEKQVVVIQHLLDE